MREDGAVSFGLLANKRTAHRRTRVGRRMVGCASVDGIEMQGGGRSKEDAIVAGKHVVLRLVPENIVEGGERKVCQGGSAKEGWPA